MGCLRGVHCLNISLGVQSFVPSRSLDPTEGAQGALACALHVGLGAGRVRPYVGARIGTCFACLPRYDAEFRRRLLGPRDFSLPLARVTAHASGRLCTDSIYTEYTGI
eukprot:7385498-Prymnesium_polylepis.1